MNTKDWHTSEARRQEQMTAAERHQLAQTLQTDHSLKQKLGTWMVNTGESLLEDNRMTKRPIRTDVQVRGT